MKELKAFIRTIAVDSVVRALREAGAPGITISHVRGVGYDYDPEQFTFAPGVEGKAPDVVKIEVVCRGEDVDRLVEAILDAASTGCRGDGLVFVLPVEDVVKVRTRQRGAVALRS